jgi:cytochrome P450/NADPH-cytochrome P450 reductase
LGLTQAADRPSHGTPALVLYGSNLGTTEEYARDLARAADQNGFDVTTATMDEFAGKLPRSGAVIIACSSYNGAPPDNAAKFVDWMDSAEPGAAAGVTYAIFGCGHSDWAATFQATPRAIDAGLERLSATRIGERAEGDARDDIDEQFDAWAGSLWPAMAEALDLDVDLSGTTDAPPLYLVEDVGGADQSPLIQQSGAKPVRVLRNDELQSGEGGKAPARSTRHIEVALSDGMTYQTGDHLCVVPRNSDALIQRVMARFGYAKDARIKIVPSAADHSQLPTDGPISVYRLLSEMVELQAVASRRDVATLARYTECPKSAPALQALAGDDFKAQVQQKRVSVLELLERFPACTLPFGVFLELMPVMAQRYYSISSSGLTQPDSCSITVGVVNEPAISGHGQFKGVCSNYLADLKPDTQIHANIKATSDGFRLPEDPAVPVIMIGPGTGIAPFRGFLQHRAHLKGKGKDIGPAMLFFGCRHPDQDFIYKSELEQFAKDGVTDLFVAFSRLEKKKTYVQDLIRDNRDAVWALLEQGAKVFVCGDGSRMEPDARRALSLIYSEEKDVSADAADAWMDQMMSDNRYVLDVWVSN